MWLTIAGIVLIAAIGFVVLALAMQWREFDQGLEKLFRIDRKPSQHDRAL